MPRLIFASILTFIFVFPAIGFAQDCANLTGLQVAAGFLSWLNVLRVFVIVVGVLSLGYLLKTWLGLLIVAFATIPVILYEIIGYAFSIGMIVDGHLLSRSDQIWPILTGCLLLAAMLMITGFIRNMEPNFTRFCAILWVVWSIVALCYNSQEIGFIAIAALMGMLGFSAAVIPMGYAIGFTDDNTPRATAAALIVLIAGIAVRLIAPQISNPFETGVLWLGSFVAFLGFLIMASYWYSRKYYALRQIAPILFGILAITIGNIFGMPQVAGIGGTFFVLYLVEKVTDIPVESATGYAMLGLMIACFLGAGVWWGQHHMDAIKPYLLF